MNNLEKLKTDICTLIDEYTKQNETVPKVINEVTTHNGKNHFYQDPQNLMLFLEVHEEGVRGYVAKYVFKEGGCMPCLTCELDRRFCDMECHIAEEILRLSGQKFEGIGNFRLVEKKY